MAIIGKEEGVDNTAVQLLSLFQTLGRASIIRMRLTYSDGRRSSSGLELWLTRFPFCTISLRFHRVYSGDVAGGRGVWMKTYNGDPRPTLSVPLVVRKNPSFTKAGRSIIVLNASQ